MTHLLATLAPYAQLPAIFYQNSYLAVCFPVAFGGLIGYRSGTKAKEVYGELKQPPGKPPAKIFGPVWTAIYGLTGFASYLARNNSTARTLYTTSLLFNFAWTPLFFGNERPGYALFDIVALWVNIAVLTPQWQRTDKRAGAIGLGYLAWVSFATYLNGGVWYLNYSCDAAAARKRSDEKAE